jgi:hypothetical protein
MVDKLSNKEKANITQRLLCIAFTSKGALPTQFAVRL